MALSANAANQNATTSRILNKLNYAFANIAEDISTAATSDIVPILDADDNYELKYGDAANLREIMSLDGLDATDAELTRVADASARVVTSTQAGDLQLTVTEHAERIVLINTDDTGTSIFRLPESAATGEVFTFINNTAMTQGVINIAAYDTGDVLKGVARMHSLAGLGVVEAFLTTASSDKISLDGNNTGGAGYDRIICIDAADGVWSVQADLTVLDTGTTPFSAT